LCIRPSFIDFHWHSECELLSYMNVRLHWNTGKIYSRRCYRRRKKLPSRESVVKGFYVFCSKLPGYWIFLISFGDLNPCSLVGWTKFYNCWRFIDVSLIDCSFHIELHNWYSLAWCTFDSRVNLCVSIAVLGNHDYLGDTLLQIGDTLTLKDKRWYCQRSYQVKYSVCSSSHKGN